MSFVKKRKCGFVRDEMKEYPPYKRKRTGRDLCTTRTLQNDP